MKYFSILAALFLFGCAASNPGIDSLRQYNEKNPEVAFNSDREDGKRSKLEYK